MYVYRCVVLCCVVRGVVWDAESASKVLCGVQCGVYKLKWSDVWSDEKTCFRFWSRSFCGVLRIVEYCLQSINSWGAGGG